VELHIDAGAWASVKITACLANLSRLGVKSVFSIGLDPLVRLIFKYTLVSPKPMSSAMKNKILGLFFEPALIKGAKKLKPAIRRIITQTFIYNL
jgi:hypothetical protein